jgi:hypothetical protein
MPLAVDHPVFIIDHGAQGKHEDRANLLIVAALGGCLFAAFGLWVGLSRLRRWLRRARVARRFQQGVGEAAATAIAVPRADALARKVDRLGCRCGGKLVRIDQGGEPLRYGERTLHVARLACRDCKAERSLYFEITDG